MYCPTSPQSSLFEVENMVLGALPDTDWCFIFKEKVLPLIDKEKFKHFYHETTHHDTKEQSEVQDRLIKNDFK